MNVVNSGAKRVARDLLVRFAALARDRRHVRFARARRRLDQRIEHRLEIEGRAAR